MTTTVRGIVENFLLMVSTYGLVPNGGRIYYTKRSQPPFLTMMMKEYVDKTADIQFLRTHLSTLEKELHFFEEKRTVTVTKVKLFYSIKGYVTNIEPFLFANFRRVIVGESTICSCLGREVRVLGPSLTERTRKWPRWLAKVTPRLWKTFTST